MAHLRPGEPSHVSFALMVSSITAAAFRSSVTSFQSLGRLQEFVADVVHRRSSRASMSRSGWMALPRIQTLLKIVVGRLSFNRSETMP